MPTIPASDLACGHLYREGSAWLRVYRDPIVVDGYLEVATTVGTRRFEPDAEVFVARTRSTPPPGSWGAGDGPVTPDLRRGDVEPLFKQPAKPKPKWRKPVKPYSDKRAAAFDLHDRLRAAVLGRDGGCVLHGETDRDCSGGRTVHHRRKASAGGVWSLVNLVELCAGHNVDIEDRPAYYRERWPWLVVREGDAEWKRLGP